MSTKALVLADWRGGRNGADPDVSLPPNQVVEAENVDWYQATLGRKRAGSSALSLTSAPFTGVVSSLIRHVPGADETAAELWGVDDASKVGRLSSAGWSTITPYDAIATRTQDVRGVSHNGKLFLCYDSTVDRLHCWDGSSIRRVGLAAPAAAPTAANAGSGTYAATVRYYKQAFTYQSSGITVRRSELSATLTFTPSGSGASVTVTRSAGVLGESPTHWELYGSANGSTYYLLSTLVIATDTYSDSTLPSAYSGAQPDPVGWNTVPTSAKFAISDGNRLLMGGSWETGGKNNRVWYTPVLGTSDVGDDERIPNTTDLKYWVDLDENDGGFLTGFGGPMSGSIYAFKYRQIWKLVPTGLSAAPYRPLCESKVVGAINQESIIRAEDEGGRPALYFLSHRGPYRLGVNGLEYLGHDVEDLWATINLAATSKVACGVYHSDLHQAWWWIATGSANDPTLRLVFDTKLGRSSAEGVRYGWSKATGSGAGARCVALGGNTIGATQSRDLKPYIGRSTGTAIWKCDTGTDDAGTAYQALLTSKPHLLGGLATNVSADEPQVLAKVSSGVVIEVSLVKDFGIETQSGTIVLSANGAETRVLRKVEGIGAGQSGAVQVIVGDPSALSNTWTLDAISVPYARQEPR
jgi:hypothetical protein